MQSQKVASSILFTELGIVTDVRAVQPEKADASILVTELGSVTEVRPQPAYLYPITAQRFMY